ncbi:MAG: SH3 domain-containing protein, partial [Burkholderiales bacterium]|nr:SH3 domain-containing protein [Anaerolineae bacterium]
DRPGFDYATLTPGTTGAFSYLIGQGVYVPYDVTNALAHIVVNTGFLNVRSGPGGQYTVIGTLPGGAELAVLALTPDVEWYLVQGSFGQGWIDSEFVLFRGNADSVPVINYESVTSIAPTVVTVQGSAAPVSVSPGTTTASARAIVNTSYLNVRSGPGGQYGLITTISGGTELAALGITPDSEWYLVRGSFGDGWIDSEFVIFRGDFRALATIQYPQGAS